MFIMTMTSSNIDNNRVMDGSWLWMIWVIILTGCPVMWWTELRYLKMPKALLSLFVVQQWPEIHHNVYLKYWHKRSSYNDKIMNSFRWWTEAVQRQLKSLLDVLTMDLLTGREIYKPPHPLHCSTMMTTMIGKRWINKTMLCNVWLFLCAKHQLRSREWQIGENSYKWLLYLNWQIGEGCHLWQDEVVEMEEGTKSIQML